MIHRTQLSFDSKANVELNELLGKQVVDIEEWHDTSIVLKNVALYMPFYDEANQIVPNKCTLYFNDLSFIINTPYIEFDKIMQDYLNGIPCRTDRL